MDTDRSEMDVTFEVTGATADELLGQAHQFLQAFAPGGMWRIAVDACPLVETATGKVTMWRGSVRAHLSALG